MSNPIHDVEYGVMDIVARIRDHYAYVFRRGASIDRMCITDFDLGYKVVGRIEIIERNAMKSIPFPKHFILQEGEETRYHDYLRSQSWTFLKAS